jgi:hypothetical protein
LPVYDVNITTTGTKHARVIERPVDFEISVSMADMQGDIWATKDQDFGDMQKV